MQPWFPPGVPNRSLLVHIVHHYYDIMVGSTIELVLRSVTCLSLSMTMGR